MDVKILLAFLICQFIIEDCHLDHIKLSDRQSDYVTLIRGMVVLNTSSIVLFVYNIYSFLLSVHGKPLVNHINRIPIAATVGHKVGPSSSKNETNITTKRYFGLPPGFSYGGHAGGGRNNGGGGCCEHGHLGVLMHSLDTKGFMQASTFIIITSVTTMTVITHQLMDTQVATATMMKVLHIHITLKKIP